MREKRLHLEDAGEIILEKIVVYLTVTI